MLQNIEQDIQKKAETLALKLYNLGVETKVVKKQLKELANTSNTVRMVSGALKNASEEVPDPLKE